MPISRERQALYPGGSIRSPEWLAIRGRILVRAGYRCEGTPDRPTCRVWDAEAHPLTGSTVVLTVAHMDRGVSDHSNANLRALCQLCHNRWDAFERARSAAATRARHLREGTGELFSPLES